jgi:hypothetical protein
MPLKVNFTDVEVRNFDPIPTGKYHVKITDAEIKQSGPASKNPGSDYINFEYTVQEGDYNNRKVFGMASLLPHALFSIKGILQAVGYDAEGEMEFELDDLIGKDLIVKVNKRPARTLDDGREVDESNEVKSYYPIDGVKSAGAPVVASNSLLP